LQRATQTDIYDKSWQKIPAADKQDLVVAAVHFTAAGILTLQAEYGFFVGIALRCLLSLLRAGSWHPRDVGRYDTPPRTIDAGATQSRWRSSLHSGHS